MVKGFRFSGVRAGIKKKPDSLDLGLILAARPVPAAAVFTRNLVRAHPVHLCEQRLLSNGGRAQACLVNSGNANACNGPQGWQAAESTTEALARAVGTSPEFVLPSSTGVIGELLPNDKIQEALPRLIETARPEGAEAFAEAIRTTDQWIKMHSHRIATESGACEFLGIGKGAGMFHPDLGLPGELPGGSGALHATMLVYLVTDAKASGAVLSAALDRAVDRTFNAASVDGDTSTNDSVFLLASGESSIEVDEDQLYEALVEVCRPLARSMVLDGEGAEHAADIFVRGLANDAEARDVARTIATSPLVKTAMTGKDANWGRLLMAAGRSGVTFVPEQASIFIDGVCICENGRPTGQAADREASEKMRQREYTIEVVLGNGPGSFTYVTSDLGHGYIDVNAGYRS